jgi:hypothetical protein
MATVAKVPAREQKWRDSLRPYLTTEHYTIWRAGWMRSKRDEMFYVYPPTTTKEDIQARRALPMLTESSYKRLLATWNDASAWRR